MADFKVSDLPLAAPMTGTELMEVVQGGVSKKAVMAFLGAIPKVINFTSATGVVILPTHYQAWQSVTVYLFAS